MFDQIQKDSTERNKASITRPFLALAYLVVALCQCGGALADEEDKPFLFPTTKDFPLLPKSAANLGAFIPKHFHKIANAHGDLNGDGLTDEALVIQATYPKFVQNTSYGLPLDTNPRALVILFKKPGGGFSLAAQNWYIIGIPDNPNIENPFQEISISRKRVLKVDLQYFQNAGSWWMSNYSYKFRWSNGNFALIGADVRSQSRASGEYTDTSYNFLTGLKRVEQSVIEPGKVTVTKKRLKAGRRSLSSFAHQDTWTELPEKF